MRSSAILLLSACLLATLASFGQEKEGQEGPVVEPVLKGLEDIPPIVANVDGHNITRRELVRELVGSASPEVLQRIVQRMLVDQEAEKRGVTVTEKELEDQLTIDKVKLPNDMRLVPRAPWDMGAQTFDAMVKARYQMSVEEYKQNIVRQRLLVKKMVVGSVQPSLPELRSFFTEEQDMFQAQATYRAAHILITPLNPVDLYRGGRLQSQAAQAEKLKLERKEKELERKQLGVDMSNAPDIDDTPEWEQARRTALEVLSNVKGEKIKWDEAVRKYTQDPHDLPSPKDGKAYRERMNPPLGPGEVGNYNKHGPMVKDFYEGTKNLAPGEIGGPIRTKFGYHIVKMLEVTRPPLRTFEDLRDQVERAYIDLYIQSQSQKWLQAMVLEADLQSTRNMIWPPEPGMNAQEDDPDPLIGKVNGKPVKRSEVWKELVRSEGPDALDRLINREMALGPLKLTGPRHLEWFARPPQFRKGTPPPAFPIDVTKEEVDLELNPDRLELDRMNSEAQANDPKSKHLSLQQFIFNRYGQTIDHYKRSLSASIVLHKAIERMVDMDEATLQMEFALAKENYRVPTTYAVSHLLISVAENAHAKDWASAQVMAEQIRQKVVSSSLTWPDAIEKFTYDSSSKENEGRLAFELTSSKGLYGAIYLELEALKLEKDQISPPIRTRIGYHLVKIDRCKPSYLPEFNVSNEILTASVKRDYLHARASVFLDMWVRSMQNQSKVKRFIFEVKPLISEDYFPLPEND